MMVSNPHGEGRLDDELEHRDDRFNVFDGKEQQIDSKRQLRVKICPKWQSACPPSSDANFERVFGKREGVPKSGRTQRRASAPDELAAVNYRENFDRIFRVTPARDESTTNGKDEK